MVQWHDFWQVFSMLTVSQVGVILGAYLAFMAFLGKDQRQIKTAPAVDATLRLRRSEGFVWWVAWRLSLSKVGRHWRNDEKSIRTCAHATCCYCCSAKLAQVAHGRVPDNLVLQFQVPLLRECMGSDTKRTVLLWSACNASSLTWRNGFNQFSQHQEFNKSHALNSQFCQNDSTCITMSNVMEL